MSVKIVTMKYIFWLIGGVFLCVIIFFIFHIPNNKISKIVFQNGVEVRVEVVKNVFEQARGLGGRENMREDEGMLFVFSEAGTRSFWMKDMRFPLDFLWIREGKVVYILEHVSEKDQKTIYTSPVSADAVLEVNAGFVEKNGVKAGMNAERK